ncbi:hypothetical protein D3C72_1035880 [compost metagenome]
MSRSRKLREDIGSKGNSHVNSSLIRSLGLLAIVGTMAACTNQVPPPVTPPSTEPVVTPTPGPSQAPGVFFRDDFDGNMLDDQKWKFFQRSGTGVVRDGKLELLVAGNQPNFPYLLSRGTIIPETGPYYFELAYEILANTNYQAYFCLDYLPAELPEDEPLTKPFMRSAGYYGKLRSIFEVEGGAKTLDSPTVRKDKERYVLRLEFDGNKEYRLIHGGYEVGRVESKRRPTRFWIGSYPLKDVQASPWPHLAIDYVAAGVLAAPAPAQSFAPSPKATPTPSPSPSPSASSSPAP